MAGIRRLIKSGVRGIGFASANSYRWFSSSSCSEGRSTTLSNVKRTFDVDTSAMVNALKAEGVPLKHAKALTSSMAQVLAELKKDPTHTSTMLKSKFESLRTNIDLMGELDSTKDIARLQPSNCETRRLIEEVTQQSAKKIEAILDRELFELSCTIVGIGILGLLLLFYVVLTLEKTEKKTGSH